MLTHWVFLGVQGLSELLPEQVWVCVCAGPAQVGLSLQEPPHAVVRRKLLHGNVLQEHQDQHVLLLVKQTEAGEWKCFTLNYLTSLCYIYYSTAFVR